MIEQPINWWQILVQACASALAVALPIIGAGYVAYKKLVWTLSDYRPHKHVEKHGPLMKDGISYPHTWKNDT